MRTNDNTERIGLAHSRSFRWFTKATEGEDTTEMVDITGDHGDDSSEMLCELRRIRELREQGQTA